MMPSILGDSSPPVVRSFEFPSEDVEEMTNDDLKDPAPPANDAFEDLNQLVNTLTVHYETSTGVNGNYTARFDPPMRKTEAIKELVEDASRQFSLVTDSHVDLEKDMINLSGMPVRQ